MKSPSADRYCLSILRFFACCLPVCLISCSRTADKTPQRARSTEEDDRHGNRDYAQREESDDIPKEEWDEELLESQEQDVVEYRRGDVCVLFVDNIRNCMDELVETFLTQMGNSGAQTVAPDMRAQLREALSNALKNSQMLDGCQQIARKNPSEHSAVEKELLKCAHLRNCKEFAACFLRMASIDQNGP